MSHLVEIFREVRRVMRPDATLWIVIGDSYWGGKGKSGYELPHEAEERRNKGETFQTGHNIPGYMAMRPTDGKHPVIKPKDLCLIPARLAIALQEDGWYVRNEIIWSKKNPMPSSVRDRFTVSHEYVLFLARSPRYYFDQDAVREPHARIWNEKNGGSWSHPVSNNEHGKSGYAHKGKYPLPNPNGRNRRSVWWVDEERLRVGWDSETGEPFVDFIIPDEMRALMKPTGELTDVWHLSNEPLREKHFAAFPQKLVEPMILAGTSERGCCPKCGAPWERIVERNNPSKQANIGPDECYGTLDNMGGNHQTVAGLHRNGGGVYSSAQTTGWRPTCKCSQIICANCSTVLEYIKHDWRDSANACKGMDKRAASNNLLSELREAVPDSSMGIQKQSEGLLSNVLCGTMDEQDKASQSPREISTQIQRLEGICSHLESEESNGEQGGLRNGAQISDGTNDRPPTGEGGSSTSQERNQGRQPPGELGTVGKKRARQYDKQGEGTYSHMPDVWTSVPDNRQCPECGGRLIIEPLPIASCLILDPFGGSGTVGVVATKHGRDAILIDLNPEYLDIARRRIGQAQPEIPPLLKEMQ